MSIIVIACVCTCALSALCGILDAERRRLRRELLSARERLAETERRLEEAHTLTPLLRAFGSTFVDLPGLTEAGLPDDPHDQILELLNSEEPSPEVPSVADKPAKTEPAP